jgi:hypothetical protein
MNQLLKSLLPAPLPKTKEGLILVLREVMQSLALLGLWRAKFFETAAFYGGTALRLTYGLDRFSEDLDFSLLKPSLEFRFDKYADSLQNELNAFGFDVSFEVKQKSKGSAIESAFLKANTFEQMLIIEAPKEIIEGVEHSAKLKIKLEIDTNPPAGFEIEMKYVFSPVQFAVCIYTLPSLFAGKMHALLCRKWKTRVKGRDWYDFIWYISHYPKLNLHHLEQRMRQSGDYLDETPLTWEELNRRLHLQIDELDVDNARKEVSPFVKDIRSLDIWSKDFFLAAVSKIEITSE